MRAMGRPLGPMRVSELARDGDCTRYERTAHLWIVYLKAVNFMLCEFLLSETILSHFEFDFTSGSVNREESSGRCFMPLVIRLPTASVSTAEEDAETLRTQSRSPRFHHVGRGRFREDRHIPQVMFMSHSSPSPAFEFWHGQQASHWIQI